MKGFRRSESNHLWESMTRAVFVAAFVLLAALSVCAQATLNEATVAQLQAQMAAENRPLEVIREGLLPAPAQSAEP